MTLDDKPASDAITLFVCGPNAKCEHDYSGWVEFDDGGARTGTAVCAKCGEYAINDAAWL